MLLLLKLVWVVAILHACWGQWTDREMLGHLESNDDATAIELCQVADVDYITA